ncbi:DUF2800 domain-containing protein [Butyrivibrio sp. MB2005]|uniref:DUF2800 domain-containing protein n=1 Tax=Butyrivibrio sp. MB2005 TaxID=1280678 RepID=UPI0004062531|nr:DUF2800 domain-containing protein [Butyrivibrio sp. MB2005]
MAPTIHSMLGGSSADRWLNCPPSAKLTADMEDTISEFAAEGTDAHALAEFKVRKAAKLKAGRRPSSDYWTDEMEECTDDYRDYVMDTFSALKEESPDAKILIEQHIDYSRFAPGGFGTADCILISEHRLYIIDFKYGRGVQVNATENSQMKVYAIGALEIFDCLYDIEEVTMVIFQPRLHHVDEWTLSKGELMDWAMNVLKPRAELAAKGEGEFKAGKWCRFCLARQTCRTRAEFFLALARLEFQKPALLSDDELSEVMLKADELSKWVADVMAYATAAAIDEGRKFPGFKVVEGRSIRKFSDEKKVEEAALAAGYSDIYNKSLMSLSSMEKYMGKDAFGEILGEYVIKPKGKLTLVLESDKRPEVMITNVKDEFDE